MLQNDKMEITLLTANCRLTTNIMSGHSKWHSIRHKKAIVDAKKGRIFTRIANAISAAARQGGGDPNKNFRLRLALDQAKAANMPAANTDRAIKRGTGELGGAKIEEIIYEGYGPGGIAVLVEAATDNRNRTSSEVRTVFTKNGGSLGESGSVAYLFDKKGQVQLAVGSQQLAGEELELAIIDSGAEDFEESVGEVLIYTKPNELAAVQNSLKETGIKIDSAELIFKPKVEIKIAEKEKASKIIKLMDALEDLDDIVNVFSNFNIDEGILKEFS